MFFVAPCDHIDEREEERRVETLVLVKVMMTTDATSKKSIIIYTNYRGDD